MSKCMVEITRYYNNNVKSTLILDTLLLGRKYIAKSSYRYINIFIWEHNCFSFHTLIENVPTKRKGK